MKFEVKITLDLCPINQKYTVSRGNMVLSPRYRKCKKDLIYIFQIMNKVEIKAPYRVSVVSNQYQDIDSSIKVILDALEAADVIENDKHVRQLEVEKYPIRRGHPQNHVITVSSLCDPSK